MRDWRARARRHRTTLWSVAEVVVGAAALFGLYRVIVLQAGIAVLGVWSLVLATTSLARLADVGGSAGLGRFMALAGLPGATRPAREYLDTTLVATTLLFAPVALVGYLPGLLVLRASLPPADAALAERLLPFALASLVLNGAATAVLAALVGQGRADLKSALAIGGIGVQLGGAALFLRSHGVLALAWAQIAQNAVVLGFGWIAVQRLLPDRRVAPWPAQVSRGALREVAGFGARLQAATVVNLAFEPLLKVTISALAGPATLGWFDMALRVVQQARQVVTMPTQALLPALVTAREAGGAALAASVGRWTKGMAAASLAVFLGLVLLSPLVSLLWIGRVEPAFVAFTAALALGWSINAVTVPAYLLGMADGRIGANLRGHLVTTLGAPPLAAALHLSGIAAGPALAASLALAGGSLYAAAANLRREGWSAGHVLAQARAAG